MSTVCAPRMPAITYLQESDPQVQAKVRNRFRRDIEALAVLGFREVCCYREQFGLLAGVINLPMFLLMLACREVMQINRGLQASASFVLMTHPDPPTVVVPLRMGVKLYTSFADRTLVITANFPSCALPRPGTNVVKSAEKLALADAWSLHQQRIRALEAEGKRVVEPVGFDQYVEVSRQEETAIEACA